MKENTIAAIQSSSIELFIWPHSVVFRFKLCHDYLGSEAAVSEDVVDFLNSGSEETGISAEHRVLSGYTGDQGQITPMPGIIDVQVKHGSLIGDGYPGIMRHAHHSPEERQAWSEGILMRRQDVAELVGSILKVRLPHLEDGNVEFSKFPTAEEGGKSCATLISSAGQVDHSLPPSLG